MGGVHAAEGRRRAGMGGCPTGGLVFHWRAGVGKWEGGVRAEDDTPPDPRRQPGKGRMGVMLVSMPLSATRTLVLMPVAIALNIVLGSTVQQVLKLPIYLDSLGTVITGVLAGPVAGLATGALTDLLWAYVLPPPLAAPTAGPFAVTAAVIGLLAGLWGR